MSTLVYICFQSMLIYHICISRECQDHQGKKERVGMLVQWLVLLGNLST